MDLGVFAFVVLRGADVDAARLGGRVPDDLAFVRPPLVLEPAAAPPLLRRGARLV